MNILEMSEIGKFIRKVRKEKGLRLEDLADEHISTATISNIERGVSHVNKDKVLYLMSKLELDLNEIPEMIEKDTETLESMQVKFAAIETMIQMGMPERALALLSNISEESHSRHQATIYYLKGKAFIFTGDWRKAERELGEAIRLAYQDPYSPMSNLEAAGYSELAYCRFRHKDYEQALRYVERGLETIDKEKNDGCDNRTYYMLLISRIIYLEGLNRTDEAFRFLEEMWAKIPQIQSKDIIIKMYVSRMRLLKRMKLYHDSIRYAREGIRMSIGSKNTEEIFQLWNGLGQAYIEINQLDDAATCFRFVRELADHVENQTEMTRAYCYLGKVYFMQGKNHDAYNVLKKALELAEKLYDPQLLNQSLFMMGKLLKQMKRFTDAVEYLKGAAQIASKNKMKSRVYDSYYELAGCYEALGDTEGFKSATGQMYKAQAELEQQQISYRID
ncbi:helix-turn-helix domain-containing protein [Thermoactinomyces mirandus]|uniref:Tetratricopeptide repeat protein n=1 Tax=Thermoactinomyces mirandus TaxID=2756294 RepID=A0A7W1XSB2_9BACL|nr:helix-turn-helix domain-containing protein [Thermoactinomyces mirandus]MBA4602155.1 tetratricopeptide repeat protein [Thermoactinomyces mirandus]